MFDYQGPVFAANRLTEFREDHAAKLPEAQNEKLRELNREVSPVPKLLGGMEVLYAVAVEAAPSTVAARKALHETLGVVSRAIAEGQYGGAEKRDRAWAIMAWAAHQIEPNAGEPAKPDVDPAYTTVPPEPVAPPMPVPVPA